MKERQLIPAGLADLAPGPELARVLAGIDLGRLSGWDCVEVLKAQHRQASHEQARLWAAMVEVGLARTLGADDQVVRMAEPDEFSADEVRAALAWTRAAAARQFEAAYDLVSRLPSVFAALEQGRIDVPKALVFSRWTFGLTDEQARTVCDRLLGEAAELTTGQLVERIKKRAIAIDPEWAKRLYDHAVRDRKMIGYSNADGTANISGVNLPKDRAVAACAYVDGQAWAVKQAGDPRPIDHIRADIYLALLEGIYTSPGNYEGDNDDSADNGVDDASDASVPDGGAGAGPGDQPTGSRAGTVATPSGGTTGSTGDRPPRPTDDGEEDGPEDGPEDVGTRPGRRGMAVELRVQVTTLMGLDRFPGEIAGWGPVHAELARRVAERQVGAEWRFAVTADDGRLLLGGITRRRPATYSRPARSRTPAGRGVVELQIPLTTLRDLNKHPEQLGGWAAVVADIARQVDEHLAASAPDGDAAQRADDDHERRFPAAALRRQVEIRDRTCGFPGCRAPARRTDKDHTVDHAAGGLTAATNLGCACRHDHRLKHEGGWRLAQPTPGQLIWTSRLGRIYRVRPPPIIDPMPHPIPRPRSHYPADLPIDDGADTVWYEPPMPTKPTPRPAQTNDNPPF